VPVRTGRQVAGRLNVGSSFVNHLRAVDFAVKTVAGNVRRAEVDSVEQAGPECAVHIPKHQVRGR